MPGSPCSCAARRSRRGSPSLGFLVVAAFLLLNKVWSPQYSLWLVPLAVLALPRWRLLLAWMTLDALVWVPRMFYYVGPSAPRRCRPTGSSAPSWPATLVVVALMVLVVRSVLRPATDPVRTARPRIGRPGLAGPGAHDRAARRQPAGAQLVRTRRALVGAASRSTTNAVGTRSITTNSATSSAARPHTPIATACAANPPPMPASRPALSR